MHQFYPNPDWSPKWDAEEQLKFLKAAREVFVRKTSAIWLSDNLIVRRHKQETLQWLYKWGRDYQVLSMDFAQFCALIVKDKDGLGRWPPRQTYYRYKRRWRYGLPDYFLDFRVRHHHAHVPKKEISENERQRREWRERKQFRRDKARNGWGWPRRGCGRKTWAKRLSNRKERSHVRKCLHHDREILPHLWFVDAWMWD